MVVPRTIEQLRSRSLQIAAIDVGSASRSALSQDGFRSAGIAEPRVSAYAFPKQRKSR